MRLRKYGILGEFSYDVARNGRISCIEYASMYQRWPTRTDSSYQLNIWFNGEFISWFNYSIVLENAHMIVDGNFIADEPDLHGYTLHRQDVTMSPLEDARFILFPILAKTFAKLPTGVFYREGAFEESRNISCMLQRFIEKSKCA